MILFIILVMVREFANCRLCVGGSIIRGSLFVNDDGWLVEGTEGDIEEVVDMEDAIIAPGFLELQTNGLLGFHFTQFESEEQYQKDLERVAEYLLSTGVTGFYPTLPTVEASVFQQILPLLREKTYVKAASILGAHVEGPFLSAKRKGAHNESLLRLPSLSSIENTYGTENISKVIKVVTLAPELPDALSAIQFFVGKSICVSLGHSNASFEEGKEAIQNGAKLITHTFNAMSAFHHREPGIVGLICCPLNPWFSVIADGVHVHPCAVTMAYRGNPEGCVLVTDSVELAGMPDGEYPGNQQVPHKQEKIGNRVVIKGTDTLIGTSISLDICVRNLAKWANIPVEKAIQCVTENVANLMNLSTRGKLEPGRRADFVLVTEIGEVKATYLLGKKVWPN